MSEARPSSRPIQSCFQCRRRKIKCSRSYPCTPCLLREEGHSCREVGGVVVQEREIKRSSEMEDVLRRIQALEGTVTKLSRLLARDEQNLVEQRVAGPASTPVTKLQPSIRASFGSNTSEEDVAMMLEDFAMGHKVNRSRATQDVEEGSSTQDSYRHFAFNLRKSHPLALLIDPSTNVISRLLQALPTEPQCRCLIQFYFKRLEWYSKVLHRPTFLSESDILLQHISENNTSLIRTPFLGAFCMVLCLSLHLIEPHLYNQLQLDHLETSDLSQRLYSAAQACLHHDDFLGSHSLEHLQCIILMGIYQQNLDDADAHWAILGSAIKIAQNLGISRLGSEAEGHRYPATWRSVVQREVARRVWWTLIFDDWSHAAAHNGTYSIHPSQNHTGHPANIDDADLIEGQPLVSKSPHHYTEMTSFLCRLRFVELYRQVVDYIQSPMEYTFVAEMDKKISRCVAELPSFFELSGGADLSIPQGVKGLEMTLCLIMGETRRLRLHRPFLFRGYKEKQFAQSREQCVTSAKAILGYLKANEDQSVILLKWWIVLFYSFAAAVVLFIDLCHHKADEHTDLEERRADLRNTLRLLKSVEHISAVSRNAIALLQGLLLVEPEITANPSRKRRAPEGDTDGPFEQIVKRMIADASKSLSSPTVSTYVTNSRLSVQPSETYPTFSFESLSGGIAPGVLFRDAGIFGGVEFDDATMVELSQILCTGSDSYTSIPMLAADTYDVPP